MIGVIGLGLIGGSMAKALNQLTDNVVYGYDINENVVNTAKLLGAIEGELPPDAIGECDMLIIALYPQATIDFLNQNGSKIKKGAIVVDCCGVKRNVCETGFKVARENGFTFVGGHPMAGVEHSGFKYSKKAMFNNASMVLVPEKGTAIETVEELKKLFISIGFTNVQISTPEEHDRMIAFTSQLAHVVSGAFIKSPTAREHKGFSAGSYKDLTRVARLNEDMWTELFLEDKDNLVFELDSIISELRKYRDALNDGDEEKLKELLKEGREAKENIDGERL